MQKPETIKRYMKREMIVRFSPLFHRYMNYQETVRIAMAFKSSGYSFPILHGWVKAIINERKMEDLLND